MKSPLQVADKKAEVLINLNTILTGLMLMVMSWVGYNIDSIKKSIGELNTVVAVVKHDTARIEATVEKHINDPKAHLRLRQ